ncbi:MAG: hypothetical protein K5663_03855 [Clostridiales bacterium]|nr:hypothetical protein [Clostridiales bacterium]
MTQVSARDLERLRALARLKAEYAYSPENERILKQWEALAQGRRETPTVRLLFSNFRDEVVYSRLECEGEQARGVEAQLLSSMVGRELFGDDTPISPTYEVCLDASASPFGIRPRLTRSQTGKGFHIEPVIEDLEKQIDELRGGGFSIDKNKTRDTIAFVTELFGDILPPRVVQPSLTGAITNPLVQLMGMENYYVSMYDCPKTLHEVMEMATRVYEEYYDALEARRLLLPTRGISPVAQESFAFNSELPSDKAETTADVWGFLESQETTAVSPATFGEFVYPYQDRLARRYGLLSYGCCERVDAIWPDYLSKWKNLRKLSVSPFNNERLVGEYLRGSNVVYYSKPRAEYVTQPGPLDEDALRRYFKGVFEASSGCLLEIAQREVGTIFGDFERGRRYVEITRQCVNDYWKP